MAKWELEVWRPARLPILCMCELRSEIQATLRWTGCVDGVIVLSRWTRIGSYIVMAWLVAIAANLLTTGMFYDLAVRDLEIAVGAFALSQLTVVREESTLATKEEGLVGSSDFVRHSS